MTASEHLNDVQFHGTTPHAAEAIAREGFRTDVGSRHGQYSGRGVYLHPNDRVAAAHGPVTVAAQIDDRAEIHPNPYADPDVHELLGRMHAERGGETHDNLSQAVSSLGFHGHHDPDDGSTVIYDPKHVHYLTHYRP